MKKVIYIFLITTLFAIIFGENAKTTILTSNRIDTTTGPKWVGWSIIGAEYVAGPIVASQYWWKNGFGRNPFTNINEQEHYAEDKMWHFWNGVNLSDLHYWTLKKYFGKDNPYLAMGMTFITLTGVECLDASDKDAKWGFSLLDETSNILGILYWYTKHKSPKDIPIDIRIGIRRWDKTYLLFERAVKFDKNFDSDQPDQEECCPMSHYDNYSIFKAEAIVRPYNYFYVGFAASLKTDDDGCGKPENLFGVTAGFDFIRYFANKYPTKFTPFLNTFGKYCSASLAYTYWFGK
ncbi:hypothetical protein J7L68_07710 [bacterium]|nr:hypothetical protein [bacterium]